MKIEGITKINWTDPVVQLELLANPGDETMIYYAFQNAKKHAEWTPPIWRRFLSEEEKRVVEMILRCWWIDKRFLGMKIALLSKFSMGMTKKFASFYSEWIRSLEWSVIRGTILEDEFRMAVHELDKASEGLKPDEDNMDRMQLWAKGAWGGPILYPIVISDKMLLDIAQTTAMSLLWEDNALEYASHCFRFGTGHLDNFVKILDKHFPEPTPLP